MSGRASKNARALPLALLVGLAACGQSSEVYLGRDAFRSAASDSPPPPQADAGRPAPHTPVSGAPGPAPIVTPTLTCQPHFDDCDGAAANGCEADLRSDPQHCGACGARCEHPDCFCEDGTMVLRCPTGRADCDQRLDNGCEIDLRVDLAHCGACERECHARGSAVTDAACIDGACVLTCTRSMLAPRGDCDGAPDNGCEALLWADPNNCGTCGVICDEYCSDSICL